MWCQNPSLEAYTFTSRTEILQLRHQIKQNFQPNLSFKDRLRIVCAQTTSYVGIKKSCSRIAKIDKRIESGHVSSELEAASGPRSAALRVSFRNHAKQVKSIR